MEEDIHKASLRFYLWECRYRGYYAMPYRCGIEMPFLRYTPYTKPHIDDGEVRKWWERLFDEKKVPVPKVDDSEYPLPKEEEKKEEREVLLLSFPKGSSMPSSSWQDMLILLSSIPRSFSFELMARHDEILVSLTCVKRDYPFLRGLLSSSLPSVVVIPGEQYPLFFDGKAGDIAIADLGLEHEFMLPIASSLSGSFDPLFPLLSVMEGLKIGERALYQILFKSVQSPVAREMLSSVSDGEGGSFFRDDETILEHAQKKASSPLFSVVVRVAGQGSGKRRSKEIATLLINALSKMSDSGVNRLVPLSNLGYSYRHHAFNIFERRTNRGGMILNTEELALLVHTPHSFHSTKLGMSGSTTNRAPHFVEEGRYLIGENSHHRESVKVFLNDEARLSHMHVIGVTGTGKSTLLANLFLEDVRHGNGCMILDPHGDIVDDILLRIPKKRLRDVILVDPSDLDFPIGFNILHAEHEFEKIQLSSDLVDTFRRYATSWGDRMTSVLSSAIDTFLDSRKGGTLLDLKEFLVNESFRKEFLKSVSDLYLKAYWERDFKGVKYADLAPLLLRLDTFLRPRIVRNMMAQEGGLDFTNIVRSKKIVLVKLAQGLIGEGNAHLLGTLIVAKMGQVGLARQSLKQEERHPYYLYLDEFHHLATPSIADMVSGLRKFGIGLVLAHQDLVGLGENKRLLHSVLANPCIRVCFRLSSEEAKIFEKGFAHFESQDFVSLERGEALVRVGGSSNDFNLTTAPLVLEVKEDNLMEVRERSRKKYSARQTEISFESEQTIVEPSSEAPFPTTTKEEVKEQLIRDKKEREHEILKVKLGKMAQDLGFRVVYEEGTEGGGRIDLVLHDEKVSIACEVSVTNTANYEVANIKKCLDANYTNVFMISPSKKHSEAIESLATSQAWWGDGNILFLEPNEFVCVLQLFATPKTSSETIIRGYRVKVNFGESTEDEKTSSEEQIAKAIVEGMKKRKK